jgi:hypothetical protein
MPENQRPALADVLRDPSLLGPAEGREARLADYLKTASRDYYDEVIESRATVMSAIPDGHKIVATAFAEAAKHSAISLSDARLVSFWGNRANALELAYSSMDIGFYAPVGRVMSNFLTEEGGKFRGQPETAALLSKLADSQAPDLILDHLHELQPLADIKGGEEIVQRALARTVQTSPDSVLSSADIVSQHANGPRYVVEAFAKVLDSDQKAPAFYNIGAYPREMLSQPWFEKAMREQAVGSGAAYVAIYSYKFRDMPYADDVTKDAVQAVLAQGMGGRLYMEGGIRETLPNRLPETAHYKAAFPELVRQATHDPHGGALSMVQRMNARHELPAAQRFDELKHLDDPAHHFNLITYGRAEAFTSSYNGMLDDMLGKMKAQGKGLMDVVAPDQMPRMATFLEAASSYNRLGDVMKFVPDDKVPKLVENMSEQVATSKDLSYIVALADMMKSMKGDAPLRQELEKNVKHHFENAASPEEKAKFGLLASIYHKRADAISPDMKPFFYKVAADPQYNIPDLGRLDKKHLVDAKGTNNQLMVFSSDEDGEASFDSFKKTYAGQPGWKVENKGTYMHVRSTGGKVPVHIYANMPQKQEEGLATIRAEVAARQGTPEAQFQTFVGRGHSYHAESYLRQLSPGNNLVYLGSCGGYQNVVKVLAASPDAQVIATRGTGSMTVNDPMLFHINRTINGGRDIVWSDEQKYLNTLSAKYRDDYMLPDKNDGLMMQKRFAELVPEAGNSTARFSRQMGGNQFRPNAPNRRGMAIMTDTATANGRTNNGISAAQAATTGQMAVTASELPNRAAAPDRRSLSQPVDAATTANPAQPQSDATSARLPQRSIAPPVD